MPLTGALDGPFSSNALPTMKLLIVGCYQDCLLSVSKLHAHVVLDTGTWSEDIMKKCLQYSLKHLILWPFPVEAPASFLRPYICILSCPNFYVT